MSRQHIGLGGHRTETQRTEDSKEIQRRVNVVFANGLMAGAEAERPHQYPAAVLGKETSLPLHHWVLPLQDKTTARHDSKENNTAKYTSELWKYNNRSLATVSGYSSENSPEPDFGPTSSGVIFMTVSGASTSRDSTMANWAVEGLGNVRRNGLQRGQ